MRVRRGFWNGFGAGAAAGAGAALLTWKLLARQSGDGRVLRFEKSLQIGRPVEEVFRAWSNLETLPEYVEFINSVERRGDRSFWSMNIGGRPVNFSADITQYVFNQAIGWKSVNGPKHTGRIDFSPLGDNCIVHVTMNYAPPGKLAGLFAAAQNPIEEYIDEAFRGFKAALEGKGREQATGTYGGNTPGIGTGHGIINTSPTMQRSMSPTPSQIGSDVTGPAAINEQQRGSGAHLSESDLNRHTQSSRFGGPENTVDYTRPPEAKS